VKRRRVVIAAIVGVVAVASTAAAARLAVMTPSSASSPKSHLAPTKMALTARDDIQNLAAQAAGLV
jgi:hypothetical protein